MCIPIQVLLIVSPVTLGKPINCMGLDASSIKVPTSELWELNEEISVKMLSTVSENQWVFI